MTPIVAIVQARMGSTRLPGKVLASIAGRPLLGFLLHRLRELPSDVSLYVATTTRPDDNPVVDLAMKHGVSAWRGSETDVLDRFMSCVRAARSDIVVRLTGDNPCVDAELVRLALEAYRAAPIAPYVLTHFGGYPPGLSVEVLPREALEDAWRCADAEADREHVTSWVRARPFRWPHAAPVCPTSARTSLTVDTLAQLERLRYLDHESGGTLLTRSSIEIMQLADACFSEAL